MKENIINILKDEVVPAMGCTEPVAVALACSKAREVMNYGAVKKLDISVSPNIYKNGLCVGIPYTDEVGLNIAGALGVVGGKSEKDLKVLEGLAEKDVISAKKLVLDGIVNIGIKDTSEKVYIEVYMETDRGYSKVIIRGKHNNFQFIDSNGQILLQKIDNGDIKKNNAEEIYRMKIRDIIRVINDMEYSDLEFLLEGIKMNEKIAQKALDESLGMGVGAGFLENIKKGIISDDLINNAMMLTAAGADARMSGVTMPVMSSSGSGNNGLTAVLPIVAYKRIKEVDNEKLVKALAISHMITGYIKYYIGRLSPLCGCGVAAGAGSSAAIAWLMGANNDQIDGTIKNMIANISGMICDGAKVGCALKLATSASTAIQSAILAINNKIVPSQNGIVAETVEDTIENLGILGNDGMNITDKVILNIMKKMEKAV